MKRMLSALLFAGSFLSATTAYAAEQTVKLSVPGMNCASCPYMIKRVISAVDGVKTVTATLDDRSAIVTFDDAITNVGAITEATARIGYPSNLIAAATGS